MGLKKMLSILLIALSPMVLHAQDGRSELQGIDDQVQTLKKEVIQIHQELSLLEEKLLFPSTTQISVFVSVQARPEFRLDSAELSIDGQPVEKYIYTYRELEAMQQGGVQRLHTGNVATGAHKVDVVVRGKTAGGSSYEKSATMTVDKKVKPKFIELQIFADSSEPVLNFKDW